MWNRRRIHYMAASVAVTLFTFPSNHQQLMSTHRCAWHYHGLAHLYAGHVICIITLLYRVIMTPFADKKKSRPEERNHLAQDPYLING